MRRHADEYSVGHDNVRIEHLVLVAHNGKVFDIPILMQQLSVHRLVDNSNSTDTSDGDTTDDDDSITPAGYRWEENSQFQP